MMTGGTGMTVQQFESLVLITVINDRTIIACED